MFLKCISHPLPFPFTSIILASKTCTSDLIPIRLFQEVPRLINSTLLDIVTHILTNQPTCKESILDPNVLANC